MSVLKDRKAILAFFLFSVLQCGQIDASLNSDEIISTLSDQQEVSVTIYNGQLALIKDIRKVDLNSGFNNLAIREVSAQMRPETALLKSLTNTDGIKLIEQNFNFDLLSPHTLLEKYVGELVQIVKTHPTTGKETMVEAIVLSVNNGVVLRIGNRIETGYQGRLVFDNVPSNLRDRPTLVVQLSNAASTTQQLQLSYLTGGLGWKADYVAELNQDDEYVDLTGWVTLNNVSGTSYKNANLQLVAGDVNRVKNELLPATNKLHMNAIDMAEQEGDMKEESLFEYHLYTLQRPTTILDNQTKQVSLLSASKISVNKEYLIKGQEYYYRSSYNDIGQKLKVGVFVEFKNSEKSNLGMPLPKGTVRVYKNDKTGNAQFIGEDHIDHTPVKEDVRLKLGDAFDITVAKKQTKFKKAHAIGKYKYAYSVEFELVIKNAKNQEVEVIVHEPIPGDWKMQHESHKHSKATADTAEWKIKVPAEEKVKLEYSVLVRF